jgi:hypothetical protein
VAVVAVAVVVASAVVAVAVSAAVAVAVSAAVASVAVEDAGSDTCLLILPYRKTSQILFTEICEVFYFCKL